MSRNRQSELARTRFGRVLLHLACLNQDWRVRRHWAGIVREFKRT